MEQQFYLGIVEDRKNDPLKLGRVRVRVFGVHSESLDDVPTDSLPWAISLMPATSASLSGIGHTVGYVEGSMVFLFFQDGSAKQQPVILGSAHGIPLHKSPFGSAGSYLIETFDDVTPIDPPIDIPADGEAATNTGDNGFRPDYRGIDGNDGDQVYQLETGGWSNPVYDDDNPKHKPIPDDRFLRKFDKKRKSEDDTSHTVSVDGWYESEHTDGEIFWYDGINSVGFNPNNSVSVKSELTPGPRENYKGQYGDNRDAIFLDKMTVDERQEYDRARYTGGIKYERFMSPDGTIPEYFSPETRIYYLNSEHFTRYLIGGVGFSNKDFYYDDLVNSGVNGNSATATRQNITKSVSYPTPISNYSGIKDSEKDIVVVNQSGSFVTDTDKIPSDKNIRRGVATNATSANNTPVYSPAYEYYYESEHKTADGKYYYDVELDAKPTPATATAVSTATPKSSGVDTTKAVAKYGEIVNTVYKVLVDFGIKNNEAIIAILCNVGKECKFVPKREDMTYKTVKQLKAVFPSKFKSLSDAETTTYLNNDVKLANFVYANSDGNGDVGTGDGYKYRGGGLIQLTKKSNYSSIGSSLGIDLIGKPELTTDVAVAAKIVAQYFINRYGGANRISFTSTDEALTSVTKKVNPGGFSNDYPKVVEESKLYVNNGELAAAQEAEIANPNDPNNDIKADATTEQINSGLISRKSYTTNKLGFKDPAEKYPLESLLKEPDTNRLTRRNINQTIVAKKRKNRRTAILSTGKDKFQEPPSAYNAQYPYNKVFGTESGHVLEFDDTYGAERINLFHTSGTFIEIDAKGNQINKIIGDNFSIIERNGFIYIDGVARVTVGGDVKLKVGGNLDIDVDGDLNYTVKGSINTKVGKDCTTHVVGKVSYNIGGIASYNYRSSATFNSASVITYTAAGLNLGASGQINIDGSKTKINSGKTPKKPVIPSIIPATNTSSSPFTYNLPESFVDSEIIKLDDAEEKDVIAYRAQAINSGLMTQRQIDDGDKIANDNTVKKDTSVPTNQPTALPESCSAFADKTNIPETLQLSKSFTLGMLSTKAVVSHYKVSGQRGLTEPQIVCNLKKVAENCLDYIKVKYPNMFVTSGFRTGSGTSQHELGEAVDLQFTGASKSDYFDIAVWIKNNVIFDKLLLEYKTTGSGLPWIHISYRTSPRKEIYTFMNNAKVSADIRKLQ